jgi:sulfate/thiosulfate transport system ATP-binding protein
MSIEVSNLTKQFNGFTAVDDVSFKIETGELVALLGPSGSGKSTLLRMIAGLEIPDGGSVKLTGKETTKVSPKDRSIGFVFQHYALFKHMNLYDNIAFGLKVRKLPKNEIKLRVRELLDLVQLTGLDKRYPFQISGGQRQRVAVARALAAKPDVLLLDEPFGALDAKVREELRKWILLLHEQTHVTTLFVTHDQHEALEIAHKIFVMNKGVIEQEGSPVEIFDKPATPFVAKFVGENNFIESEVAEPGIARWGPLSFQVNGYPLNQKIEIYFRPNDVLVNSRSDIDSTKAIIAKTKFKGALIELQLLIEPGKRITAHLPKGVFISRGYHEGADIYFRITEYHSFVSDKKVVDESIVTI